MTRVNVSSLRRELALADDAAGQGRTGQRAEELELLARGGLSQLIAELRRGFTFGPPVGIVAYTGQVTRFAGAGRLAIGVALRAEVTNLKMTCSTPKEGTQVTPTITFDIIGERGPASTESGATLRYFVAQADENQKILKKEVYDTSLAFGPGGVTISHEKLRAQLPKKGDEGETYEEILIGLQLERDEFGYNLARSAGK